MPGPTLHDDIWTRRGISLLWDADALCRVCTPQQVVSLRRFYIWKSKAGLKRVTTDRRPGLGRGRTGERY